MQVIVHIADAPCHGRSIMMELVTFTQVGIQLKHHIMI